MGIQTEREREGEREGGRGERDREGNPNFREESLVGKALERSLKSC